jgi:hypothetical protein
MTALTRAHVIVAASAAAEAVYKLWHHKPTLTTWWRALTASQLQLDDLARLVERNPNLSPRELFDNVIAKYAPGDVDDASPLGAALAVFQASLLALLDVCRLGAEPAPCPTTRRWPLAAPATPDAGSEPAPEAAPADDHRVAGDQPAPAPSAVDQVERFLERGQAAQAAVDQVVDDHNNKGTGKRR